MNRIRAFAILACAASVIACEKNTITDINGAAPQANMRFFNFGVSTPGVNFYANTQKVTAISSTTGAESTTGINPGGVGNGGVYSSIPTGTYTLSGKIAATTDKDLAISSTSATVESGKYYSYYLSGPYDATTKKNDAFIVEDAFPVAIDFTQASVHFVNAVSTAAPQILYAKNTTTGTEYPIGGAIGYKSGGAFVNVPFGVYDLSTRLPGSSASIYTRTAVTFGAHAYTIAAQATSATAGTLDLTTNR